MPRLEVASEYPASPQIARLKTFADQNQRGRDTYIEENLDQIGSYYMSRIRKFEFSQRNYFILNITLGHPWQIRGMLPGCKTDNSLARVIDERYIITLRQPLQWSAPTGRGRYERYLHFGRGVVEHVARHVEHIIQGKARPHFTADDLLMLINTWEIAVSQQHLVLGGAAQWDGTQWLDARDVFLPW